MGNHSNIKQEDFIRILEDICGEEGETLLAIDGVYEIVSEHFNNEVLARWELEQTEE